MICALGDAANLRSGYPFRSGLTPDSDGTIAVVQGRDVEADRLHFRPVGPLVRIMKEELRRVSEHFLQPGDVLLMARGPRNYAAVVEADISDIGPAIAVGSFHIITPDPSKLVPLYLAWWLSQEAAQNHFRTSNTGTTIPMISLDAVRLSPLQLPPLPVQQRIADLSDLFARERETADILHRERQHWLSLWARQQSA